MTRGHMIAFGLLRAAVLACVACGPSRELESATDGSEWVARIRSAQLASDAAIAANAPERALASLRGALDAPVPREVRAEHHRVVQQDLLFQIGELELGAARPQVALATADRGLSLGHSRDVFTANLWIARGEALEALGRNSEAAASYAEALAINSAVLHR